MKDLTVKNKIINYSVPNTVLYNVKNLVLLYISPKTSTVPLIRCPERLQVDVNTTSDIALHFL